MHETSLALAPLIRDLAVILGVAALVTLFFRKIKQPVVLGYIVAGMIVGPFTPPYPLVRDLPNVRTLAELGVIFLMFSLGLEFSFRKLARVGISVTVTAICEIAGMLAVGFFLGRALGWSVINSMFLGAMLSISSTTIIVKALDELQLKSRRFAEMVFGILIVEDLAAILLLVSIHTFFSGNAFSGMFILESLGKLTVVIGGWVLAGYFVLPTLVRFVGRYRSDEMLTVWSVGLCLLLAVAAASLEYSVALGAFIMGSILAETTESQRIEDLVRPLKDLFAAIFFVSVGMMINPASLWEHRFVILIISLVTILGKVMITTFGALVSGQTLRTSVLVGFSLGQIGEFSFIIAGLGLGLGVLEDFVYAVAVAVSLVTTFATPYLIRVSPVVSLWIENRLPTRVKALFAAYGSWMEKVRLNAGLGADLTPQVLRWFLNGFAFVILAFSTSTYAFPAVNARLDNVALARTLVWATTLLLSSPFIWGMLLSGRQRKIFQVMTVLLVAIVGIGLFPVVYVGVVTIAVSTILFWKLRHYLSDTYHWVETVFLSTFTETEKSEKEMDFYKSFAPWDAHLVRIKVHADSEISGRKIADLELRKRFGINVVAIQRGSQIIIAPSPQQQIFPKDELLVLGTDDQVESAKSKFETASLIERETSAQTLKGYDLAPIYIARSAAKGTIRELQLREKFGLLVVGVERGGERILNPDSDEALKPEDILWVVGERDKIELLKLSSSALGI